MAFTFDAKAALARASNKAPPPSAGATLATAPPPGAPSVGAEAVGAADLDAFEERAAIAGHGGGVGREEAERGAAGAPGLADPARLAAALREHGPLGHGAAATALGWGASRAWRADAALRQRGLIDYDRQGRAVLAEAWDAFERANDPNDPEAWR